MISRVNERVGEKYEVACQLEIRQLPIEKYEVACQWLVTLTSNVGEQ